MPRLSTEQAKALAPDPASLKAATTLTDIRYWSNLGSSQIALWGDCQGSGREPYRVCIDLADNATHCTCPSRKFPCKHALGLMLVAADSLVRLPEAKPPAWAAEWIDRRSERRQTETKPAEPAAEGMSQPERKKEAERRASKRIKLAEMGIAALEQWLKDFARLGLAAAQSAPASFWSDQAARMVDAQLPGAARLITEMSMLPGERPDWAEVLVLQLGRLYLLTQAFRKLDSFPFPEQQDILTMLGWNVNQKELLASTTGIWDDWLVMASRTTEDEKTGLRSQVNWLYAKNSQRIAQILNFAYKLQPLDTSYTPGLALQGELVYFPGAYPQRAIFRDKQAVPASFAVTGFVTISAFLAEYASALGRNPWLRQFPAILQDVRPLCLEPQWLLRDGQNRAIPLEPRFARTWELLAISGGHPVRVFGLWDGFYFSPWTVWAEERCTQI